MFDDRSNPTTDLILEHVVEPPLAGPAGLVLGLGEVLVQKISDGGVGNHLVAGVHTEIAAGHLTEQEKTVLAT